MALFLTPCVAPAYQAPQCNPFGLCAPPSRPAYTYRVARPQPRRPQPSSFNPFSSQVDELLREIDREAQRQAHLEAQRKAHLEAQREAHRQRQQRKRALRAEFAVSQNEQGWQVDGEIQGFEKENISIELTDEHTLKITGNTRWQSESTAQPATQRQETEAAPTIELATKEAHDDTVDGAAPNEPEAETASEAETATAGTTTPDSDTESHKSHRSYQATVEDDFEDLGAETSSLVSASSGTSTPAEPTEPTEPKGKEKAVEEPEKSALQQLQQTEEQERVHGSFERTFRFPERFDAANVSASFKEGTLKITVPRAQTPQTRRVAIL